MIELIFNLFEFLRVIIFLFIFILIPGFVLNRFLIKAKKNIPEEISLSFTLGFGVFVPFSLLFYYLNLNLNISILIYMFLVLLLCYYCIKFKREFFSIHSLELYDYIFFIVVLLFAPLFYSFNQINDSFANTGNDYWYHLGQIRFIVDAGIIKNVFPFFKEEIPQYLYPYNSYYLIIAMTAKCVQVDIINVWAWMQNLLGIVLLSSLLLFFRLIFHNKDKALIASFMMFLCMVYFQMKSGVGGQSVFKNLNYPKVGSLWIFFPIISSCLLLYINEKNKFNLIAAIIIGIAFQNWHVVNAMFIGIICSAWIIGFMINKDYENFKKSILFSIIIFIIPFLLFYFLDYQLIKYVKSIFDFNSSYLADDFYGTRPIIEKMKGFYITKASYFFTFGGNKIQEWMVWGFFILPLSIWLFLKNRIINSFLLGFTIFPLFLAYNPLTVTIMVKYGAPFLVRRFLFFLPIAYAFGFISVAVYDRMLYFINKEDNNKLYKNLIFGFSFFLLFFPILNKIFITEINVKHFKIFLTFLSVSLYVFVVIIFDSFYKDEEGSSNSLLYKKSKMCFFVLFITLLIYNSLTLNSLSKNIFKERIKGTVSEMVYAMHKYIITGSTVLSDIYTSHILNAFRWVNIVTAKKLHIQYLTNDYIEKEKDLIEFFNRDADSEKRLEIARKYKADYIISRKSQCPRMVIDNFEKVFQNKEFEIWKIKK